MEPKRKKIKILLPIFICLIMITSILGFMSSSDSEKVKYKGYVFREINNGWSTYIKDKQILLVNNPDELKENSTGVTLEKLNSAQKIYLSINPEDNLFLSGLQNNIIPFLTPKLVTACYEDTDACINLPLKDCKDAVNSIKVILVKKSENSKFYYKDNCLVIEGDKEEIIKSIDRLTLELLFNEI